MVISTDTEASWLWSEYKLFYREYIRALQGNGQATICQIEPHILDHFDYM